MDLLVGNGIWQEVFGSLNTLLRSPLQAVQGWLVHSTAENQYLQQPASFLLGGAVERLILTLIKSPPTLSCWESRSRPYAPSLHSQNM